MTNTMLGDDLETQWAKATPAIVSTKFSQNIPFSALQGLK